MGTKTNDIKHCIDLTEQHITKLRANRIVRLQELGLRISEIKMSESTLIEHIYWHSGWSK